MIPKTTVEDLLKVRPDGSLSHRESQTLEFKESFNMLGFPEYLRDFAAFANNKGGWLILGVKDRPKRELVGLNDKVGDLFDKLDPQIISGHILDAFSCNIQWENDVVEVKGMRFGVFHIEEAKNKPIISKKDFNKEIKAGEIYYRYGGRTQKIQYAELEQIIERRIAQQNDQWIDIISKIAKAGPNSAAILDLKKGTISKESQILVVDEKLLDKINWIKEGSFNERDGLPTLKLIGDVQPMQTVGIVKTKHVDSLSEYPLSAKELAYAVNNKAGIGVNMVWRILRDYDIKSDPEYSVYNFRYNKQKEQYEKTGVVPNGVPSIFKESAIDYIINLHKNTDTENENI